MANDHYVPQFYLRSFKAVPGKVWCYERGVRPVLRGIKSVASEDNYYTLKGDIKGVEKDRVDKIFQNLESGTAPIIEHLKTASKIDLVENDAEMLAMFIAHSLNRTPHQRERIMNLHTALSKEVNKIFSENKEIYEATAKRVGLDADPELLEQTRQMALNDQFEFVYEPSADDYFLGMTLELADTITPIIRDKEWHLLESKTSRVFVTSDNPVVLMPPEDYDRRMGLGVMNAIIGYPLSPRRCLLLTNGRGTTGVKMLSRESVMAINQWTILRAHKQVYANLESQDVESAFNETVQGHNTRVQVG